MEDFAIRVRGLSKKYSISNNSQSLLESLKRWLFFWKKLSRNSIKEFYALKDISFEIKKGETIGIIGPNGAGKSTLLKILSEVTEPSEGMVELDGKIASVLEVGMGFHPELSGRENVYLSGAMLGLSKSHIDEKFDEIVEFSGVEKFIDTPVKHYSSGMYVRLAFSVVVNIDADILLFDEVLSVGDIAFRAKCEEKILSLISDRKTILIVSHNNNDIYKLCEKVMYLENGRLDGFGSKNTINNYMNHALNPEGVKNVYDDYSNSSVFDKNVEYNGVKVMKFVSLSIAAKGDTSTKTMQFKDNFQIEVGLELYTDLDVDLGFALKRYENYIMETGTYFGPEHFNSSKYKNRKIRLNFEIPTGIIFASGMYLLSIYIAKEEHILFADDFMFELKKDVGYSRYSNVYGSFSSAIKILSKITVSENTEISQ